MKECFFGHRDTVITEPLKKRVYESIEEDITKGFDTFYFGGFGSFDELCYQVVTELKTTYTDIKRVYILTDRRHLQESKRPKYLKDGDYEDFVYICLPYDYWYTRLYYRNRAIIDQCDKSCFYVDHENDSGAYNALQYAIKKKKQVYNFFIDKK